MKKFTPPEMEIIIFKEEDVIVASSTNSPDTSVQDQGKWII